MDLVSGFMSFECAVKALAGLINKNMHLNVCLVYSAHIRTFGKPCDDNLQRFMALCRVALKQSRREAVMKQPSA